MFGVGGYYFYKTYSFNRAPLSITITAPSNKTVNASDNTIKIINQVKDYHLPQGEQVFNISHGTEVVGPKAKNISYNPLAIEPNKPQTFTVTFPPTEVVSSGVIFVTTDNKENQRVSLKHLSTGTPENVWSGTWTPTDTINKRYSIRLYFVGQSGTYNSLVSFI